MIGADFINNVRATVKNGLQTVLDTLLPDIPGQSPPYPTTAPAGIGGAGSGGTGSGGTGLPPGGSTPTPPMATYVRPSGDPWGTLTCPAGYSLKQFPDVFSPFYYCLLNSSNVQVPVPPPGDLVLKY